MPAGLSFFWSVSRHTTKFIRSATAFPIHPFYLFDGATMLRDISPQNLFMGILAAFVGSASSFAVVLQGLGAVGERPIRQHRA